MLTLKDQFEHINTRFEERLSLLKPLMEECNIDCWVILAKEYNEDPLMHYLTPAEFITARRLTMLVLIKEGNEVLMYNGSRKDPSLNKYYTQAYDETKTTQWQALENLFVKYQPKNIALNYSEHFAFSDGLSKGLYDEFVANISADFVSRIVSGELLGIRFLETRTDNELADYQMIAKVALDIISETYSDEVIKVNHTTANDLEWYMHQRTHDLGMPCWFLPTIDIQRAGVGMLSGDAVIIEGDLIHCDFGLKYLNLCTDTQRLCYVLKENESVLPQGLRLGMEENSHFQDIVAECMKIDSTGNDVFVTSKQMAEQEGIECLLYSHPIGFYGHGPGPTIGLYNQQEPIPVKGDLKLYANTCYALELTTVHDVEDFGQVRFMTEETVCLDESGLHYLMPNRTDIYLVNAK